MARYVKSRGLLPVAMEAARVFEQAQSTLRAAQDEFEGRAHAGAARREARRLLEQQLASHYPNAYQCGGCGFGPVDHAGCNSLVSHHGQHYSGAVISNACPNCGWFSRSIKHWPKWNGRLLPEREGDSTTMTGPISPELARSLSAALSFVTGPTTTPADGGGGGGGRWWRRGGGTARKQRRGSDVAAAAREAAAARIAIADARAAVDAASAEVAATTRALASAGAAAAAGPVVDSSPINPRNRRRHDREMERAMQMSLETHVLDQATQLSLDEEVLRLARVRERQLIDASNAAVGRQRCIIS